MGYFKLFENYLLEKIRSEEAHRDENAVQTVVDGKRDLGFLTVRVLHLMRKTSGN